MNDQLLYDVPPKLTKIHTVGFQCSFSIVKPYSVYVLGSSRK